MIIKVNKFNKVPQCYGNMALDNTCTVQFTDPAEQAKAFYELIHSKASFSGVDKNTLVINKQDCAMLKNKNIKYQEIQ